MSYNNNNMGLGNNNNYNNNNKMMYQQENQNENELTQLKKLIINYLNNKGWVVISIDQQQKRGPFTSIELFSLLYSQRNNLNYFIIVPLVQNFKITGNVMFITLASIIPNILNINNKSDLRMTGENQINRNNNMAYNTNNNNNFINNNQMNNNYVNNMNNTNLNKYGSNNLNDNSNLNMNTITNITKSNSQVIPADAITLVKPNKHEKSTLKVKNTNDNTNLILQNSETKKYNHEIEEDKKHEENNKDIIIKTNKFNEDGSIIEQKLPNPYLDTDIINNKKVLSMQIHSKYKSKFADYYRKKGNSSDSFNNSKIKNKIK